MVDKILFFGRNLNYPLSTLGLMELYIGLASHHEIVGVVHTCEDDSKTFSLRKAAKLLKIPTIYFENNDINSEAAIQYVKNINPTLIIVVQFPKIFKPALFSIPKYGTFNVHRGYPLRGGSIDQRLIMDQFSSCSLIFHAIDEGVDTGDILEEEEIILDPMHETGLSIDSKTSQACIQLFRKKIIPRIERSDYRGNKQSMARTKYANKWKPQDKVIDPKYFSFFEGERLARALSHPREKGLLLLINKLGYLWSFCHFSEDSILIEVQWKDQMRKLLLTPLNQVTQPRKLEMDISLSGIYPE